MSKLLKRYGVWALALTMTMVGCDSVQDGALMGPGDKDEVLITWTSASGYTVARETDPTVGVVTAVIGENGGALSIGKHLLVVPAGAVSAPTTFVMNKLPGSIKVDLTATQILPNDIGARGFDKPVRLHLSYENTSNVSTGADLFIAWRRLDGTVERQSSSVDSSGKVVSTNLNHFSIYEIGIE